MGGLFGLGVVVCTLWLVWSRKRRRQTGYYQPEPDLSEASVNPFPSGNVAQTRQVQTVPEKSSLVSESIQAELAPETASAADTETTPRAPPARDATPVPSELPNGQVRLGIMAGLTTDELVTELNQRIGWNDNDTLPEYPGSVRGEM
ncbi:hypothetical protein V5O48_006054 [Marasmius crinis-equi]|uniref:Uncharacterized protein n=1 Tax=Marasmius crinis-equi TaxID=585013 RepID=A0ABR3FLF9_9AGAR